ncbi:MAG: ABC transporter ATP-binding protein [Oscillospiraceae bacterium]|nr:ABC transporter ATP-binding protein [Oscillospiraceae bacterium]
MYVQLENINKKFGGVVASDNINFGVEKGHLVALLGPSGSGKTTVLRMVAGLEQPDSGNIIIDGQVVNDVKPSDRGIGFVFQNYALFRYMTVFDNIAFGLTIQKKSKKEIRERVLELMELTGLSGLENRYPNQLSGGQRQRVAFARALAPNPHLLLLDEPFAAIDAKVRLELRSWLREMISRVGITSIFVTHDQDEAVAVADEIIIMNSGRIEQTGNPVEIYKHPQTPFAAQFIGSSSVISGYGSLKGFETLHGIDTAVVRPEFIEVFKADNDKFHDVLDCTEEGIIEAITFMGSCLELTVRVGTMKFTVERSLERRAVEIGEKMRVLIYRLYVFDEDKAYLLENAALEDKHLITF